MSVQPPVTDGAPARAVAPVPGGIGAWAKRGFDLLVAVVLLVLTSPLTLLIALAIRLDSPGPALFRQRRVGRASREFVIYKFRTMHDGTPDLASHLMAGQSDRRITRLGGLLRRSSFDELPQLLNIVRGDMSLVGPRPALHNQHDLIAMRQRAGVDALRPGVTGWAQVNGRDEIPMELKVAHDRWYLEHHGLATDLIILFRTPFALLSARGVN